MRSPTHAPIGQLVCRVLKDAMRSCWRASSTALAMRNASTFVAINSTTVKTNARAIGTAQMDVMAARMQLATVLIQIRILTIWPVPMRHKRRTSSASMSVRSMICSACRHVDGTTNDFMSDAHVKNCVQVESWKQNETNLNFKFRWLSLLWVWLW